MRGRSTVVIAHRPATIALADRVVLLEGGRVVAEGTHHDLLATEARYRRVLAAAARDESAAADGDGDDSGAGDGAGDDGRVDGHLEGDGAARVDDGATGPGAAGMRVGGGGR